MDPAVDGINLDLQSPRGTHHSESCKKKSSPYLFQKVFDLHSYIYSLTNVWNGDLEAWINGVNKEPLKKDSLF